MSIAENSADARSEWQRWRLARGVPDCDSSAGAFAGCVQEVIDQFQPWLGVGIDHFVVELVRTDAASVGLAGRALSRLSDMVGAQRPTLR